MQEQMRSLDDFFSPVGTHESERAGHQAVLRGAKTEHRQLNRFGFVLNVHLEDRPQTACEDSAVHTADGLLYAFDIFVHRVFAEHLPANEER